MSNSLEYYRDLIKDFWGSIRSASIYWPTFLVYVSGYFFFWYLTLFFSADTFQQNFLYPALFLFFWHRLFTWYGVKLKWPAELLLLLVVPLMAISSVFLPELVEDAGITSISFLKIAFTLISGIWVWGLGTIFRTGQPSQKASFLPLILLYIWFISFNHQEWPWLFLLHQFILFVYLWNFTRWAENLSLRACWAYFLLLSATAILLYSLFPWSQFSTGNAASSLVIFHFISRVTLIYLFALIAKFPFVVIYHHAHLTRKLRIASLFQTNVPQIIQFILLVSSFYFIVGNWQAHQLDKSIRQHFFTKGQLNQPPQNFLPGGINTGATYSFIYSHKSELKPTDRNFYIVTPNTAATDSFNVSLLDSASLANATRRLPLLAGQNIHVYLFKTVDWDSLLYTTNIWGQGQKNGLFKVFPFGIFPKKGTALWNIALDSSLSDTMDVGINVQLFSIQEFTLGRLFLPVYNDIGKPIGFLGVDITFSLNRLFFSSDLARQLLFWLVIFLLINFLVIRRVIRFGNQITALIIQKFNALKAGTRHLATGNLDYRIQMDGEDEFAELAEHFNTMGKRLKSNIEELRKKDRLEYELKIARDVQLGLLPKTLPQIPGYQVSAYIRTAMEVGGDFYDVVPLDKDRYLFMIGDVSGKGTSAAFYMAQCISLFRYATYSFESLQDILKNLNRYFTGTQIDRQIFVTAIIGLLDTRQDTLEYYRAGHTYPYWLPSEKSAQLREIKSSGMGIGLDRTGQNFNKILQPVQLNFKKGDALILLTDGVLEAAKPTESGSVTFFNEDRFWQSLDKCRGKNAEEILEILHREIADFYEQHPPVDDYTILVVSKVV